MEELHEGAPCNHTVCQNGPRVVDVQSHAPHNRIWRMTFDRMIQSSVENNHSTMFKLYSCTILGFHIFSRTDVTAFGTSPRGLAMEEGVLQVVGVTPSSRSHKMLEPGLEQLKSCQKTKSLLLFINKKSSLRIIDDLIIYYPVHVYRERDCTYLI